MINGLIPLISLSVTAWIGALTSTKKMECYLLRLVFCKMPMELGEIRFDLEIITNLQAAFALPTNEKELAHA